jgi:PhnB protein
MREEGDMAVKPIPEGYHSVTPYLLVEDADGLIDFIKGAFGAEETLRMPGPDGKIGHAELRVGDSIVMLAEASTSDRGTQFPAMLMVYVEDADKTYRRALEAGGSSLREPRDEFYGDRSSAVRDRFGNDWWIHTHVEDVPPEEMARRAEQAAQS